jgi:nucleotide-binding universal stress UspA family protein
MNTQTATESNVIERHGDYKKILVGMDYLDSTSEVFDKALELAKHYHSSLMVFHCVQGEMPGVPVLDSFGSMGVYSEIYYQQMSEYYQKMRDEARDRLLSWLRGFAQKARDENVEVEFNYKIGDPGKVLCQTALHWNADLIVIGRRGKSGLSELFLGSVSNYVVHNAHCSVLVVQH